MERDHYGELDIDGRIKIGWGDILVDWNHPGQDRDHSRALVNMVMNLRVS
jgi:hypothetical protein